MYAVSAKQIRIDFQIETTKGLLHRIFAPEHLRIYPLEHCPPQCVLQWFLWNITYLSKQCKLPNLAIIV